MKKRTAWVLVAAVVAVSLGAAAFGLFALALRGGQGSLMGSGHSYLQLRLEGDVPEQPPPTEFGSFLERRPPSLKTIVESLDRAADDPKITGVLVKISQLPNSGWGQVQELRDSLLRFKKSGKPVVAHMEYCGNKEYYLATACSKVYAVPSGLLGITGLAAEVTFLHGTLDKLGIEAQFEGVGKYKNAPNTFTETGFTAPHREQMDALLDSLSAEYFSAIAKARHKTLEEVRSLVDQGPYDAQQAVRAGLVDAVKYRDEIDAELKGSTSVSPGRYVRSKRGVGFGFGGRPKIALVYAVGEIVSGSSETSTFGGSFAGADTIAGALRDARNDDSVRAIVLRVDSPGGSGSASDVIWREMQLAHKKKPVIVSMGDLAASGGYYISMGSDVIVAEPGTITGSIGVFSGKFALRGLYDKLGIHKELLLRGAHSGMFSEYRPWSPDERARIRGLMVDFYEDFVKKVAQGRGRAEEQIDAIAQGRVWTGVEAKERGLVDRLGGLETAIGVAKDRAKITGPAELVVLPERKGIFETFMERGDEEEVRSAIPLDIRGLLRLSRLLSENGPIARLPFELQIR